MLGSPLSQDAAVVAQSAAGQPSAIADAQTATGRSRTVTVDGMAGGILIETAKALTSPGLGTSLHFAGAPWLVSMAVSLVVFVAMSGPAIWNAWGEASVASALRKQQRQRIKAEAAAAVE